MDKSSTDATTQITYEYLMQHLGLVIGIPVCVAVVISVALIFQLYKKCKRKNDKRERKRDGVKTDEEDIPVCEKYCRRISYFATPSPKFQSSTPNSKSIFLDDSPTRQVQGRIVSDEENDRRSSEICEVKKGKFSNVYVISEAVSKINQSKTTEMFGAQKNVNFKDADAQNGTIKQQSYLIPRPSKADDPNLHEFYKSIIGTERCTIHTQRQSPNITLGFKDYEFNGEDYTVVFDYHAENVGDIELKKGEVVKIMEKLETGWWRGKVGSRYGWLPASYVEPVSYLSNGFTILTPPGGAISTKIRCNHSTVMSSTPDFTNTPINSRSHKETQLNAPEYHSRYLNKHESQLLSKNRPNPPKPPIRSLEFFSNSPSIISSENSFVNSLRKKASNCHSRKPLYAITENKESRNDVTLYCIPKKIKGCEGGSKAVVEIDKPVLASTHPLTNLQSKKFEMLPEKSNRAITQNLEIKYVNKISSNKNNKIDVNNDLDSCRNLNGDFNEKNITSKTTINTKIKPLIEGTKQSNKSVYYTSKTSNAGNKIETNKKKCENDADVQTNKLNSNWKKSERTYQEPNSKLLSILAKFDAVLDSHKSINSSTLIPPPEEFNDESSLGNYINQTTGSSDDERTLVPRDSDTSVTKYKEENNEKCSVALSETNSNSLTAKIDSRSSMLPLQKVVINKSLFLEELVSRIILTQICSTSYI